MMSDVQTFIDRQLGFSSRFNFDNILKRLVVNYGESFYGLQNTNVSAHLEEDPPIFACRFAETAGYEHILALANEDGKVALQNTVCASRGNAVESYQCHNNAVFDLAWMPSTMKFVTVSGDHTAHLWSAQESGPQRIQIFTSHTRSVKTIAFRAQEHTVFATGARDGDVLLWDVRGALPVLKLNQCHSHAIGPSPARHRHSHRATSITGLVFQNDQTLISCGEFDGNIKVWDLRKNYDVYKREPLPKHSIPYCGSSAKNGYTNLIIDDTQMRLYASCMDNVIYCFNISTYNTLPEQRYIGHENNTFYIKTCLSPDSKYLVSGSSDKNAYIWNVTCSEPVVKLAGHWAEVTCAAWCQVGDTKLVTCSDDARHKIWRIGCELHKDGDERSELQGRAEVVPRTEVTTLPQWGSLKSPHSVKRKRANTPTSHSKRTRLTDNNNTNRKGKRCLTDMLNAAREHEDQHKRIKLDTENSLKRGADDALGSPSKKLCPNNKENNTSWSYSAGVGTSFMTPTKHYEHKTPKKLSPVTVATNSPKVRILTFTTPTKNLPNFALNGEAPHHRLMSPVKKKPETTNWLTQLTMKRTPTIQTMANPKEHQCNINAIIKRPPQTPPRISSQSNTLLKYFTKHT